MLKKAAGVVLAGLMLSSTPALADGSHAPVTARIVVCDPSGDVIKSPSYKGPYANSIDISKVAYRTELDPDGKRVFVTRVLFAREFSEDSGAPQQRARIMFTADGVRYVMLADRFDLDVFRVRADGTWVRMNPRAYWGGYSPGGGGDLEVGIDAAEFGRNGAKFSNLTTTMILGDRLAIDRTRKVGPLLPS